MRTGRCMILMRVRVLGLVMMVWVGVGSGGYGDFLFYTSGRSSGSLEVEALGGWTGVRVVACGTLKSFSPPCPVDLGFAPWGVSLGGRGGYGSGGGGYGGYGYGG